MVDPLNPGGYVMISIFIKLTAAVVVASFVFASSSAMASGSAMYRVTITNITNSIIFTPILVASHRKKISIFEPGEPASDALAEIAESGSPASLAVMLANNGADVGNSGVPLMPGHSADVMVSAEHGARRITVASMLLPTNDGFFALNGVKAPRHGSVTYYSPGYDAGSEFNDDDCANIPGPTCHLPDDTAGGLSEPADTDEGYVHIHRGIQGAVTGLLDAFDGVVFDWRNPVAKIIITRIRSHGDDDD
jgi:hypothetical protein